MKALTQKDWAGPRLCNSFHEKVLDGFPLSLAQRYDPAGIKVACIYEPELHGRLNWAPHPFTSLQ